MNNLERQRKFQAAHPGYDRRRKARQRTREKRACEAYVARIQAEVALARDAATTPAKSFPRIHCPPCPAHEPRPSSPPCPVGGLTGTSALTLVTG